MLKLYDLTIEYKHAPLGLDEVQPRFSWKLDSDQQDTVQASYRLRIVQGGDVVWDSGTVASAQSILNEYLGPNLTPRTEYDWTVTVWDNHGETAEGTSRFETGLLNGSAFEGKAQWITHALDKASPVSPVLYKDFVVQGNVKKRVSTQPPWVCMRRRSTASLWMTLISTPAGRTITSACSTRPTP